MQSWREVNRTRQPPWPQARATVAGSGAVCAVATPTIIQTRNRAWMARNVHMKMRFRLRGRGVPVAGTGVVVLVMVVRPSDCERPGPSSGRGRAAPGDPPFRGFRPVLAQSRTRCWCAPSGSSGAMAAVCSSRSCWLSGTRSCTATGSPPGTSPSIPASAGPSRSSSGATLPASLRVGISTHIVAGGASGGPSPGPWMCGTTARTPACPAAAVAGARRRGLRGAHGVLRRTAAVTAGNVNRERGRLSAAICPNLAIVGGQSAQQAGRIAVVPDPGQPLSPQAADLVRRIARRLLDEPADLMAEVHAAVSAAADEPLRSEPVLAAEVAASTRANVLHWAAGIARDPGGRVPANLTPEVLGIAREAFRRGIEQTVYTTYHT